MSVASCEYHTLFSTGIAMITFDVLSHDQVPIVSNLTPDLYFASNTCDRRQVDGRADSTVVLRHASVITFTKANLHVQVITGCDLYAYTLACRS